MIMNHDVPDDFVVSTGQTHSVRELVDYSFSKLDLDYNDYLVQNKRLLRPNELEYLKGDCTKIKETLGWKPEYTFESMIDEMLDHWLKIYGEQR